ncbi:hypothetical protein [Halomonas sp. IOP_31]|uniref:hypothetical protein n=1 Tax=Halomonas sp. IOP_31 TaxID=2876584 RepID=UPI001E64F60A|nr:hypothetical protein [Halomonas sp. IOP_31]MCD6007969.1 hypothetical protein [Halomonas sp. IOP_31]|tara:strand:+ start:244 stop:459 length:216 start_codon:yes stop_codon:yes gene_type:complete
MNRSLIYIKSISENNFISLAKSLGDLGEQADGGIIYTVATENNKILQSSSRGQAAIPAHTEFPFQVIPPAL